jgi:exosortase A-associated hydrolase 2
LSAPERDEPFFLTNAGRRLFAVWQGAGRAPRSALLYVHPFGEEKKSAHRAFVEAARALARLGVASLRFDLTGCGDSEGEFRDATLPLWIDDIASAWTELRRRAPDGPPALLGLRLGGALAAQAAPRLDALAALLLWQPVVQGKAEFDTDLRRILVQQMMTGGPPAGQRPQPGAAVPQKAAALAEGALELDGYPVTRALYDGIAGIDLMKSRAALPPATAIVQFGRPVPRIQALADLAPKLPCRLLDLPPFWTRTDFLPDAGTGTLLAREGVLGCLAAASP